MDEKEKTAAERAWCKCCLLADAMKVCKLCKFNHGLEERAEDQAKLATYIVAGEIKCQ